MKGGKVFESANDFISFIIKNKDLTQAMWENVWKTHTISPKIFKEPKSTKLLACLARSYYKHKDIWEIWTVGDLEEAITSNNVLDVAIFERHAPKSFWVNAQINWQTLCEFVKDNVSKDWETFVIISKAYKKHSINAPDLSEFFPDEFIYSTDTFDCHQFIMGLLRFGFQWDKTQINKLLNSHDNPYTLFIMKQCIKNE